MQVAPTTERDHVEQELQALEDVTDDVNPLQVTGLVIDEQELVRALRIYVPQLMHIERVDNGCFILSLVERAYHSNESR